jgi:hypothetical protein
MAKSCKANIYSREISIQIMMVKRNFALSGTVSCEFSVPLKEIRLFLNLNHVSTQVTALLVISSKRAKIIEDNPHGSS